MAQVKLSMPTLEDNEEDWIWYIGALKMAAQRFRTRQENLYKGWQVHRLAMDVMTTEVWKKYPSLKKMVWSNLKITVGFMDMKMQDFENISWKDRTEWRGEYKSYMDARNKAEGRYNHLYRLGPEAEENATDKKRKPETTNATEIVFKRQKVEDWEKKDPKMGEDIAGAQDRDLPGTEETGNVANGEEEAMKVSEMDIRGIFEVDSDEDEDVAAVNGVKQVAGTSATSEGEEEEEVENKEVVEIEEKVTVEGDMVKLGTVLQSERPELEEGLRWADKRDGVFIFYHGYKSEEKLYNHLTKIDRVVNIANEDGSEFEDPENLPPIVAVQFERAENEERDIIVKGRRQKWKMYKNYFENVTLKEGGDRWDTCDDENLLEVIRNDDQIMILMKSSVEETDFYSKMTSIYYRGKKVRSCKLGNLCLTKVTEFREIKMPGRIERSEVYHIKKCVHMMDIKIIEMK